MSIPRPVRQGDSRIPDLRAHGCALASLAWLRGVATDGAGLPDDQQGRDELMLRLRKAAGMTLSQFRDRGTTMTEAVAAYRAVPIRGHLDPRIVLRRGVKVREQLIPELTPGHWAIVALNYAVIQDAGRGVGSFRGGHACVVGDPRDGSVALIDPLRKQPIRIGIDLLVRAMESFGKRPWGNGRGEAAVAYPVPSVREALAKAQATIERLQDRVAGAQGERDAAREEAKLARLTVDGLTADLMTARARIVELENATPDCSAVERERDEANALIASISQQAAADRDRALAAEAALADETDRAIRAEAVIEAVRRAVA